MMNELIFELAQQAEEYATTRHPVSNIALSVNNEKFVKEFARLLVLECEKVAKDPKWYGESPSNGWRNPIRHVCTVMKEHFGVEEGHTFL